MSSPSTTVVIVTYQSLGTIDTALSSLKESYDAGECRVVVVDNDSKDGTPERVRDAYPWVDLITPLQNLGFGRGCNLGAADAKTPYLLLLNPDAAIDLENLRALVKFMEHHPRCAICGPYIDHQHAGGLTSPLGIMGQAVGRPLGSTSRDIVKGEAPFSTDWICAAVFMMRRDAFAELGGFDPRFFMYFEETDLCRRAIAAGYELWIAPTVTALHEGGMSAKQSGKDVSGGNVSSYYYQSRYYYLTKHHGTWAARLTTAAELVPVVARAVASRVGLRSADKPSGLSPRVSAGLFKMPPPPR
jgi:N-acetylglucosaminyl-diphospho-decaprenol L-rhamnosyltransferase